MADSQYRTAAPKGILSPKESLKSKDYQTPTRDKKKKLRQSATVDVKKDRTSSVKKSKNPNAGTAKADKHNKVSFDPNTEEYPA